MNSAKHRQRRRRPSLLIAFLGVAFAILAALPPTANAACVVTTSGTVNCNANTATTDTANLDGAGSLFVRSDPALPQWSRHPRRGSVGRHRRRVRPGPEPRRSGSTGAITMNNQGEVTTTEAIDALHIDGNGGAIRYSGNGGVTIPAGDRSRALRQQRGRRHIHRYWSRRDQRRDRHIEASTTAAGALTIVTGSGLVNGTTGRGIFGGDGERRAQRHCRKRRRDQPRRRYAGHRPDFDQWRHFGHRGRRRCGARRVVPASNDVTNIVGGVHADIERDRQHHRWRFGNILRTIRPRHMGRRRARRASAASW